MKPDRPLLVTICAAGVAAMISYALWPVFLVQLGSEWALSNSDIGWISGAYFIGYVIATPLLVGLTDTVDAKWVFVGGCLASLVGCLGFALAAADFWTAAISWSFVGAGLAGTYMPGLQILNARLAPDQRIRAVPFYTSCFGIGTGASFLLMGFCLIHLNHVTAALIGAAGSVAAALAVIALVRGKYPEPPDIRRHPLDLRPAFRKPEAMGYIAAYGAHTYELFAYRGWSFALFIFLGSQADPALSVELITILVSLLTLTGMAASIIGAAFCVTYGRHRVIMVIGAVSAGFAVLSAVALGVSPIFAVGVLWLYNVCIMLDSGALTAGTVSAGDDHDRGALLAVHSMVGFGGGALGGPVIGYLLDMTGGKTTINGWMWAVLAMGVGSAIVGAIQWRFWRRQRQAAGGPRA